MGGRLAAGHHHHVLGAITDPATLGEETPLPAGTGPSRRAVLGGTALIALPALCGCSGDGPARAAPPGPDVAVLTGAIGAEQDLIARYEAARGSHASLA